MPNESGPIVVGIEGPKKKIVVLETPDAVESAARDVAERKMTANKGEVGLVRRWWKHNIFQAYFREKEIIAARKAIEQGKNVYAGEDGVTDQTAHNEAMGALFDRFSREEDETLHNDEERRKLEGSPNGQVLSGQINDLVRRYASSTMTDAAFEDEKNRLLSQVYGVPEDQVRGGVRYADNLLMMAQQVRAGAAIDGDFEVVVGNARRGVRTEAEFKGLDRLIGRVEKSKVGRLFGNESVAVALGAAAAYSVTRLVTQSAFSRTAAIATFGGAALAGGAIAGAREHKRFKEERRQHSREMAQGRRFDLATQKRRKEMEGFRYHTEASATLATVLEDRLYRRNPDGTLEVKDLSQQEFDLLIEELAEVEARNKLSDEKQIDLISYSDITKVEQERLRLDLVRARIKVHAVKLLNKEFKAVAPGAFTNEVPGVALNAEIRAYLESDEIRNETDPNERKRLLAYWISQQRVNRGFVIPDIEAAHGSFTPDSTREYMQWDWIRAEEILNGWQGATPQERILGQNLTLPGGQTFDQLLASRVGLKAGTLYENKDSLAKQQDRLFEKTRKWRAVKAGGIALGSSIIVGGLAQEGYAFFDGRQDGLAESLITPGSAHAQAVTGAPAAPQPGVSFTPLEYLRRLYNKTLPPRMSWAGAHDMPIDPTTLARMPKGVSFDPNPADGTYTLFRHGQKLVGGIKFNADGALTPDSHKLFVDNKVIPGEWEFPVTGKKVTTTSGAAGQPGSGGTPGGTFNAKDYAEQHPDIFKRIKRVMWYDNDTPKPKFDRNELRVRWGGIKDSGIDKDGNFVLNIARMKPDGSFHKGFSVDAQDAMKKGSLGAFFSLDHNSQMTPAGVEILPNGDVRILKDSEAGKLMFENASGKAKLVGRFGEITENMGVDENGVMKVRVLATIEGEGRSSVTVEGTPGTEGTPAVPPTEKIEETVINHRLLTLDVPESDEGIDIPPLIPVRWRNPLERPLRPGEQASEPRRRRRERGQNESTPSPETSPDRAGRKGYYSDFASYRSGADTARYWRAENDATVRAMHPYLFERWDKLANYNTLPDPERQRLAQDLLQYNERTFGTDANRYIQMPEYIDREIARAKRQFENACLEAAAVGEAPFAPEFYNQSPLRRGLGQAEEVVLILDRPMSDAVMTVPVVTALDKYFDLNPPPKRIKIFTQHADALASLNSQFGDRVEVCSQDSMAGHLQQEPNRQRFIINANKSFEDYASIGISDAQTQDPARVMSVDWSSWTKEEVPTSPTTTKDYDQMPARILRNMELMLGQKLFVDPNAVESFIEPRPDQDQQKTELQQKYNIQANEEIVVISTGADAVPKKYDPQHWEELITAICDNHPRAHILVLQDPEASQHALYGDPLDRLKQQRGYRITEVAESINRPEYLRTLVSMADVTVSPDTGIGHLAGAAGTPNVIFALDDSKEWSTRKTMRVVHPQAVAAFGSGVSVHERQWQRPNHYQSQENGVNIGASDIDPAQVYQRVDQVLRATNR